MIKKFFQKSVCGIFMMLSLSLALSGCKARMVKEKVSEAIPVKVSIVELKELDEMIEYVGDIKAQNEAAIYPKASGKIIEKVKEEGSVVAKGEAIAYLDRDEVGLKFEPAPIESSLSGFVGRVYVDIGAQVNLQTAVALVVDMDKVKIDLDIPEKYLPRISLGQEAKISLDAYPQNEFLGQVTVISPVIDLETRTAPIEISVDNPQYLMRPGMFARVNLILERHDNSVVILREAVLGKKPNQYVYLIATDKAVVRKVILGISQGPYYEITEGLNAGDSVVIMGQQRLYDNAPVNVERENGQMNKGNKQ